MNLKELYNIRLIANWIEMELYFIMIIVAALPQGYTKYNSLEDGNNFIHFMEIHQKQQLYLWIVLD